MRIGLILLCLISFGFNSFSQTSFPYPFSEVYKENSMQFSFVRYLGFQANMPQNLSLFGNSKWKDSPFEINGSIQNFQTGDFSNLNAKIGLLYQLNLSNQFTLKAGLGPSFQQNSIDPLSLTFPISSQSEPVVNDPALSNYEGQLLYGIHLNVAATYDSMVSSYSLLEVFPNESSTSNYHFFQSVRVSLMDVLLSPSFTVTYQNIQGISNIGFSSTIQLGMLNFGPSLQFSNQNGVFHLGANCNITVMGYNVEIQYVPSLHIVNYQMFGLKLTVPVGGNSNQPNPKTSTNRVLLK